MSVNRSVGRRALLLVLISTAFSAHAQSSASSEQRFPDVVAVRSGRLDPTGSTSM
jgi:hypothetical protein